LGYALDWFELNMFGAQLREKQHKSGEDEGQLLLSFKIDALELAVPLDAVVRAVRSVAISTMPQKREPFLGWFSFAGSVVPVMSIRKRLGLPEREIAVDDVFLIVRIGQKSVAIVVQDVDRIFTNNGTQLTCVETLEIVNEGNNSITCLDL
jgi:purine-binding chemotaxis protein CheW